MVTATDRRASRDRARRRRLVLEGLFLAATLATIAICLSLVLRRSGWPFDHEYLSFKTRTELYASHFRQGDLLPVWSSSDAYGMGTPLPLLYHKVFYFVSAAVYLVVGSMRLALLGSVAAFLLLGAYGIRRCLRQITSEPVLLIAMPQALILANYTFTNWFVRGAMAELSAAMVVPWVLAWCLILLRRGRFSVSIAPLLFVLYLSHSAIALFAAVPVAVAYGVFLLRDHRGWRTTWKRLGVSVGVLVVLAAPLLLVSRDFLGTYDPSKITQDGYAPAQNFRSPLHYLVDTHFVWLRNWAVLTVQVDYGLWIPIVGLGLWSLYRLDRRPAGQRMTAVRAAVREGVVPFLVVATAVLAFLQLRLSNVLYVHLPLLKLVQFPWRLLALITPLALLLVAVAFVVLFRRFDRRLVAGLVALWLASFLVLSPVAHHFQYGNFPGSQVAAKTPVRADGIQDVLLGVGEYLPVVKQHGRTVSSATTLALYAQLYQQHRQLEALHGGPCSYQRTAPARLDAITEYVTVTCAAPGMVALPVSYSSQTRVIDTAHRRRVKTRHLATDPRIVVDLPTGTTKLRIELPTVWRVLGNLLR